MCDRGISSRSAVLVERSSASSLAIELYRLGAGTSAKVQSGPGEIKVLMGFEHDAAGATGAQPARPGNVLVLPSEVEVEQHGLTHLPIRNCCRHCVRAKGRERPYHPSSLAGCRSSPQAEVEPNELTHLPFFDAGADIAYVLRARRAHTIKPSPGGVSKFATDHMFMGEDGTPITILAGYDEGTLRQRCTLQRHESWLRSKSTCAQSDQEPCIMDVKHKGRHAHPNRNRVRRKSSRRQQRQR